MTAEVRKMTTDTADVAAEWFARRRSGQMSLQEAGELEVWLELDPAHRAAFDAIARTWVMTQAVSTDPEVLALREAVSDRLAFRRRALAAASAVAMIVVLVGGLYVGGLPGLWRDWFAPVSDQGFQTAIGQTVTVSLADGSTVMLDSDTALTVHETWRRRDITLEHGQAFFHVAKDPARPFVVSAAGSSVMATGTAFDVRIDPERLLVLLAEGRLHVEISQTATTPSEQTNMVAGWQLTAFSTGDRALVRVNADGQARALDWTTGHLAFVGRSVSEAAAEMNRYSSKKIVIAPDLASVPIDGVFRAGDIDGFVRLLVKGHLARVQNDTDASITLALLKKNRSSSNTRVHDF